MSPIKRARPLLNVSAIAQEAERISGRPIDRRNLLRYIETETLPAHVEAAVMAALDSFGIALIHKPGRTDG